MCSHFLHGGGPIWSLGNCVCLLFIEIAHTLHLHALRNEFGHLVCYGHEASWWLHCSHTTGQYFLLRRKELYYCLGVHYAHGNGYSCPNQV